MPPVNRSFSPKPNLSGLLSSVLISSTHTVRSFRMHIQFDQWGSHIVSYMYMDMFFPDTSPHSKKIHCSHLPFGNLHSFHIESKKLWTGRTDAGFWDVLKELPFKYVHFVWCPCQIARFLFLQNLPAKITHQKKHLQPGTLSHRPPPDVVQRDEASWSMYECLCHWYKSQSNDKETKRSTGMFLAWRLDYILSTREMPSLHSLQ